MAIEYRFTNCGNTGVSGPNQTQVNNTYSGTNLAGKVTSQSGIQLWTVPATGVYRIEAWGAQGGGNPSYPVGGKGARMRGEFQLSKGQVLKILVGQQGAYRNSSNCDGGGGGGSFVALDDNTPLIVAGGGGGSSRSAGLDAVTSNSGDRGGTRGHGGSGAGFSQNGGTPTWGSSSYPRSFTNGGNGGTVIYAGDSVGGFGGGAAGHGNCCIGGGAGGGYSGGDGAPSCEPGRGGGSYNNGINQSNSGGINTGHGLVTLTLMSLSGYVLVKDGDVVKTLSGGNWETVANFEELTKEHFITKGYRDYTLSRNDVLKLESDFPEILFYEFDDVGFYDRVDWKPQNVVKADNTVEEGVGFLSEDSKLFYFGEGSKPGDGSYLKQTFGKPTTVDRFSVSARHGLYDYKIKDLRLVFLKEDGTTVEHSVELPNDSSWSMQKTLLVGLPETLEGVTEITIYPETAWERSVSGVSNIQFTMLQFYAPNDVRYVLTSTLGSEYIPWAEIKGEHEVTVELPVFDISKKTGNQNSWKGKPEDYFVVNGVQPRVRAVAYTTTGDVLGRSRSASFTPYKWVSYGLPVLDKSTLADKLPFTHGEQVEFSFTAEHQQPQKARKYKVTAKNLTKNEVVQEWVSDLYGESVFNASFLESSHLINGDNIIRIYLEDELGHGTYEDIKIRKYVNEGVSTMNLGVRYATKGLEYDFEKPDGTDIRMLFSTDGIGWIRYNLATEVWESVDPATISTEGMYLDEVSVLTAKEWEHFEGKELHIMVFMSTIDPWVEPKIGSIRVLFDSMSQVRYFFNVDDQLDVWYFFKEGTWVAVNSNLEQAFTTHRGNSTQELTNITPDEWATFPLGESKIKVGMLLYTNDKTRTPIIRSLVLSDVHTASTPIEAGELRMFDGYYYSPILDMEYICQWEKINYDITENPAVHTHSLELRSYTGSDWSEWVAVTPTTAVELNNILPEGYRLQFRVYFSTTDKITTPKLLPTVNITYRISSKEILDANMQKMAEDLKQTKISLANLEFKHHATSVAQRYNLNNMVIENLNDNNDISVELNTTFTGSSYRLADPTMNGEIRLAAIDLPWFAEYVMVHSLYVGEVNFEVSFDGFNYEPINLQEKRFTPEGATQVHVKAVLLSGGVTEPEIDAISVMY